LQRWAHRAAVRGDAPRTADAAAFVAALHAGTPQAPS
jgi:hypothetical protein